MRSGVHEHTTIMQAPQKIVGVGVIEVHNLVPVFTVPLSSSPVCANHSFKPNRPTTSQMATLHSPNILHTNQAIL